MTTRLSRKEYEWLRLREQQNKEYYQRDDGLAAPPYNVCLSVNNNCFFKCKMCDIGSANANRGANMEKKFFSGRYARSKNYREFPLERLKAVADELAPSDPIFKTNFVEPLFYKQLSEFVQHVKGLGCRFYCITNGWTLARNADWLVESGTDLIRVSLDGTQQVHDAIRGQKGSHARVLAGLDALIAAKKSRGVERPIIGVCYTISNYNYHDILPFLRDLQRRGLLEHVYVNFNHLQFTTAWEVEESRRQSPFARDIGICSIDNIVFEEIDREELKRQITGAWREFDQESCHYYFSPALEEADIDTYYDPDAWLYPGVPCYLPWYAAQVDIEGEMTVYGHCGLPSFGNIMERPFLEVWNSQEARDCRKALKQAGSFAFCNRCIGTMYPLRGRG